MRVGTSGRFGPRASRSKRSPVVALLLSILAAPGSAPGDEPAQEPADAPRDPAVEYGARLFVRDTLSRIDAPGEDIWRHERSIDQARVFATFERGIVRLALEVELSGGDAELKDTAIRLSPTRFFEIEAGRFKAPMSVVWLESKWRLPSTERGILSELRQDDRALPFGGLRADGVRIELRPRIALDPRLTAAIVHNPLATGATPLDPTEEVTQDLFARLELEPTTFLRAAASFAVVGTTRQAGDISTYEHVPLGGLEARLVTRSVGVWIEGFVGRSFLYQADGSSSGTFVAGRVLVAPRIRPGAGVRRIEPFAAASVLDPTGDVSGDRVVELGGGSSLAFGDDWRLQLDVAHRLGEGVSAPIADSTLIRVQLGARFSGAVP